jgi:O-antigen/teichoic acid export membrane protein
MTAVSGEGSEAPKPRPQSEASGELPSTVVSSPDRSYFLTPAGFVTAKTRELVSSTRSFLRILRLRRFDTSTPEGRSNERYRRAALTTATAMMAHGLGVFTGLAWVRLSLSYLGKERYGLWMAIGSIVAWANLADLGLARGMQNHLSEANGRDDRDLASRYVATGLVSLTLLALALAVIVAPLIFVVPWSSVLNVNNPSLGEEARYVVAAAFACFLLEFPISLVPTIYAAYQRGYIANLFNILGRLVSLGTLIGVTRLRMSLPILILATGGSGILISLFNFGYVLKEMPWLRPRLRFVSLRTLRRLAGTSVALFVFQIGALLINETQNLIIARRLGLSQVAEWSVFSRVHLLPAIFIQMIDTPLIPAFREAHVRGERDWLRIAFWRVTKLKMVLALGGAGLYLVFGNLAATLLSGQSIVFSRDIWLASGFLLVVAVWNVSFNDLMIAVDRLRLLVLTVLVNGLVTPVISYVLAPRLGLLGVILATPVFSLAVSAWLLPLACKDLIKSRPVVSDRSTLDRG